jgi:hypothetical protein
MRGLALLGKKNPLMNTDQHGWLHGEPSFVVNVVNRQKAKAQSTSAQQGRTPQASVFIRVHPVRQAKPGRSSDLKGGHSVNCPFHR